MIRLGTRKSALALAQATAVAEALRRAGVPVELRPMRTEGDRLLGARLADVGGKGLFVREIEEALAAGHVDVAVHSLKDLPAEQPEGLLLAAFPEREDPGDVLVTRGGGLLALPPGAVVGTSSLRRRALLLAIRPDLVVEPLRGNVDTRLRKLDEGACDAIVLAAAGLRRLGLRPAHLERLAPDVFVPAVGQGIVAVEVRGDDARTRSLVASALDHRPTRVAATAERAYLRRLGASCNTPMAAHAVVDGSRVTMTAVVASEDGQRVLRAEAAGPAEDAEGLGRGLAESLLARGAAEVTALDPGRWAS